LAYEVHVAPAAERAIHKLPAKIQAAVLERLEGLVEEPRPPDCVKLMGMARLEVYRVKVGKDYRVLYQIRDAIAWVLVVKVADRKEVYRRLDDLKRLLE
jgi:mRNA interferase RelE/StbE